ncbi:unnamed protein product [Rotaria sp. Silwood2]|nr:unnamed protein product [Rotaria sp. Silwood2]CAF2975763.1 unnamed protein product [Rotaria sp. Silwood2]CAF3238719.1 unnamed protein product [Rotaria sp. Silwood2]CAF3443555.1 unnamed protein product [Rotaria sp. Silwood2]CAF4173302.1 unnamed protein product [Rotaria sp. Silwood2]
MLMIYLAIVTLCLASRISTLPAPAFVQSAVIYNAQKSPIKCHVVRSHPYGRLLKYKPFTVRENEHYLLKEVILNLGTWKSAAPIKKIRCGNLVLTAPFDRVKSIENNWEFHIQPDKILSVGPSSYVANT